MYLKLITKSHGNLGFLLVFLFLLSSSTMAVGYFIFSWKQQTKTRHLCRLTNLKTLQIVADGINDLLALNVIARRLQQKEKQALKRLQFSAMNPKALAVAMAYYKWVTTQQLLLYKQQRRIISSAENLATLHLLTASQKQSFVTSTKIKLQVYPFPLRSKSPEYKVKPNISKLQALQLRWKQRHNINQQLHHLTGYCLATITKEKIWYPLLIKDKDS